MALISDTAGIFTGDTLDVLNLMESLVLRDGAARVPSRRCCP